MKRSIGRVLTTHTGSLPRPPAILETMRSKEAGAAIDERSFEVDLTVAVADIVRKQAEAGIAVVNDGECGKPSFGGYVLERLTGFEARVPSGGLPVPTGPLGPDGRDARMFPDYYAWVLAHNPFASVIRVAPRVCVGPITYVGQHSCSAISATSRRRWRAGCGGGVPAGGSAVSRQSGERVLPVGRGVHDGLCRRHA